MVNRKRHKDIKVFGLLNSVGFQFVRETQFNGLFTVSASYRRLQSSSGQFLNQSQINPPHAQGEHANSTQNVFRDLTQECN